MSGPRTPQRSEERREAGMGPVASAAQWGAALPALYAHEEMHWWTRGMFACTRAILSADGWSGAGAVLDVGCGSGGALAHLPARRRVGVDIAPLALAYARRHVDLALLCA